MSAETLTWLNTQTLIGFTEKRGKAWHYRAEDQGDESNHYEGAIPVGDVERRLFNWEAIARPSYVSLPATVEDMTGIGPDGLPHKLIEVPGEKRIVRSDNNNLLSPAFKEGYTIHQFREWLLQQVSNILDDSLSVGSAGLLKGGAVAWVSVEIPETVTTPEGAQFRPNLLACTSHDGSLATTYTRVVTNVVCDNTMSAALGEGSTKIKVKHSRHSKIRLMSARGALDIIHSISEEFAEQVKQLTNVTVTDAQWEQFLDAYIDLPKDAGKRSVSLATTKRDALQRLWNNDLRVAPWAGTAWGVVQAINTFTHHEGIVRGADRAERNMLRAVSGGADKLDQGTLDLLEKVLA